MGMIPDVYETDKGRFEMGVFNRKAAWHTVGTVWTPEPGQEQDILALGEALRLSGLNDLDYRTQPVYADVNGAFIEVPDARAVTRVNPTDRDRREYISAVGKQTVMFQIEELGEFAQTILEIGAPDGVEVEALFQMKGGKQTIYVFRLPDAIEYSGDKIVSYLLAVDYYDGSGAVIVKVVRTRVVCANTLTLGLRENTSLITIPHRDLALEKKRVWAMQSLQLNVKTDPQYLAEMDRLMETFVVEEKFEEIVSELIPDVPVTSTDRQKNTVIRKRGQVRSTWNGPTVGEFRNTAWGVLNAFTEAQQWEPGSQTSQESLAKRQLSPTPAAFERKVLRTIEKVLA